MVDHVTTLRRALGNPPRPKHISQKPFDYDDAHLRALIRLDPSEKPDGSHLVDYALDLQYEAIVQKELLEYLLPFCLLAWRDDLTGRDAIYGGFVEYLYPALVRVTKEVLAPCSSAAVSSFMRAAIMDEIDAQSGLSYAGMRARPYRWIRALTTHGVIFPDVQAMWTAWWSRSTPGSAIASVQYLSCLIYGDGDDPVLSPWTRDGGGGPPVLWEYAGHLYAHQWLPENVAFLRQALTPTSVTAALAQSVGRLDGRSEQALAARVLADAGDRNAVLRHRCIELPELLARQQDAGDLFEWSPGA